MMNPQTKNKSLVFIIIFLLITNIVMVIFFLLLNKPERNSRDKDQHGMSGMLQKEVGFSSDQLNTYQTIRKAELDSVHMLFDEARKAKIDFYSLLYRSNVPDSTLSIAADQIAVKQKMLDLHMFHHFKMVRNICTRDQLQKFDTTIKKVIVRMTGKPGHDRRK